MRIDDTTLPSIGNFDFFVDVLTHYAQEVAKLGDLYRHFSFPRLHDAHGSWQNDLARVEDRRITLRPALIISSNAAIWHFGSAGIPQSLNLSI